MRRPPTTDYHVEAGYAEPLPLVRDCLRCAHTIDVRCPYGRRTAMHHRVIDCMAPMYGGMATQLAELRGSAAGVVNGSAADRTAICLIGESDVMFGYARALLPPLPDVLFVGADRVGTAPSNWSGA